MNHTHRQPGPDFLDSVADASLAQGLDTNAAEYRQRARDWQADLDTIARLDARVAELERQQRTAVDRGRALSDIKAHLQAANDSLAGAIAAPAA